MSPSSERRRMQNRISQRNHRIRIRNHIAQLEAQLAATGGSVPGITESTNNNDVKNGTVQPSDIYNGPEKAATSDNILDAGELFKSTDALLGDSLPEATWDFEAFANGSPNSDFDRALMDYSQDQTNQSSPAVQNEAHEGVDQQPSPSFDSSTCDHSRQTSPPESIFSSNNNGSYQFDSVSDRNHQSHIHTGGDANAIVRTRNWPSEVSSAGPPSPVISVTGNTDPRQHSDNRQHGVYEQTDDTARLANMAPCCSQHAWNGSRTLESPATMMGPASKPMATAVKPDPHTNKHRGTTFSSAMPSRDRQHNHRVSHSRQTSRSNSSAPSYDYPVSPASSISSRSKRSDRLDKKQCSYCACHSDADDYVTIKVPKDFLRSLAIE